MKTISYKTILVICSILMLYIACSKDDETTNNSIPADKRYLSKVTDDKGNTIFSVSYYDDKKIKTVEYITFSYIYIYNADGTVATVIYTGDNEPIENNYSYTNGKISSYTYKGVDYPVIYNATENSYTYKALTRSTIKAFFDDNENCSKIMVDDNSTIHFFYETNRKGALTNGYNLSMTNFIATYPMFIICQVTYNTTPIPLESMLGATSIKCSNEYDNENFLIKSIIKITNTGEEQTTESTLNYHYIAL